MDFTTLAMVRFWTIDRNDDVYPALFGKKFWNVF